MWQLRNQTPFAAATLPDRDAMGVQHWIVALRASFLMASDGGPLTIAPVQTPVRLAPETGPDNRLIHDDDIIPFIPRTDVVLHGKVDPAQPLANLDKQEFGFRLGTIYKRAMLHRATRLVLRSGQWAIVDKPPLAAATLDWTSTFGGVSPLDATHPNNPHGTGYGIADAARLPNGCEITLPQILAADADPKHPARFAPIGFGPQARWMPERAQFAGTYDDTWSANYAPLLPPDFDQNFHMSAPKDQWPDTFLTGGEPVSLQGFGTDPFADFRLPQIIPSAQIRFQGRTIDLRFRLARVNIDITARGVSMLYLAQFPCGPFETAIDKTTLRIKQMAGVRV